MSRKLLDKARRRLEAESGCHANPWGGRLSVALVYPNTYHQAMSNLGFLTVYQLLNSRDDTLCERFFLPDTDDLAEHRKTGYPLFSLESRRPLADFDLVAFSISFENDYLNLPLLFELARIPFWREERGDRYPLILCGGVCAFLNPEPLAEVMDLFAIGEAEPLLPDLLAVLLAAGPRDGLLDRLAEVPGLYLPSFYTVRQAADGFITDVEVAPPAPARVARRWQADLDASDTRSFVLTPETELGDMALTEISRGCSRGCRFCAAGFLFLPPRERSLENLQRQVGEGLCHHPKQGLVGAAVSDYPQIVELEESILAAGGKVSVASLRIDALSEKEVAALAASGHRTVALAPEAGSQRLRDLINKNLDEEQILAAVQRLAAAGIPNLKLYFLIGLPGEEESDIEELLALVGRVREVWLVEGKRRGRLGQITLSVNPFIPKPFTPFQWAAMPADAILKARLGQLRRGIARLGNVELHSESLRAATLQALLSRGDRRVGRILPALASGRPLRAACAAAGFEPSWFVHRQRAAGETFPWEVLDSGVRRDYLWAEYQRGLTEQLSPRCQAGCRRCGVCG
ncbi:radical SAM protein [Desulfuromonas carbonis]